MKLNNRGVSLISLVTIVMILLIIVGVTINISQEDGMLDKAKEINKNVDSMQVKHEIQTILLELQDEEDTIENKTQWLENKLDSEITQNDDGTITITYKGYEIWVEDDYYTIRDIRKEF